MDNRGKEHQFMKKILILILPLSIATYLLAYQIEDTHISASIDSTYISPTEHQQKVGLLVGNILKNYHYRKTALNDSLSSVVFNRYLASLDNNKIYFLDSDVDQFEKYRYKIDDYLKKGELGPAYEMFNLFRKRFYERNQRVYSILDQEFNFNSEEYYQTDRENAEWPDTEDEVNELWKKIIKDQALSLKLAGKEWNEVIEVLEKRYKTLEKNIDQVNSEDVFQIFMNAFAESFDPHTAYFSPKTSENFRISMSQSLEGIGAVLQMDNDYVMVKEVIAGGPAFKSKKIHKGDHIVGVAQGETGEMVDVIGWRLDEVVQLIRGPKGSLVRLSIIPAELGINGIPVEIKIVRDKVKLEEQKPVKEVIEWDKNGKLYHLGVITIPSFYMDFEEYKKGNENYNSTTRDVRRLLKELNNENVDGLIVDLRMNGGGSLTEAIELTGLFIPDGPVVQVKNANGSVDVADDPDPEFIYQGPLAVVVNRFSASASEIFAAAIQDYKRGVVIGEQTFGKGTVQNLLDLSRFMPKEEDPLGEMKITLAKFYRINGSSTQHRGVNPDIILPSAFNAEEFGESAHPNALPWDKIKSTDYTSFEYVTNDLVKNLQIEYRQRINSDPELKELIKEIEQLKESRNKTLVSLNEEIRKKERQDAEKSKELRMKLTDLGDAEGLEVQQKNKEIKDAYLREGLNIMADMIAYMNS